MQRQRAATADAGRQHDLAAMPLQQPDGRRINVAVERLLRTARQQTHARLPGTFGRIDSRRENFRRRRPRDGESDQIVQTRRQNAGKRFPDPRQT